MAIHLSLCHDDVEVVHHDPHDLPNHLEVEQERGRSLEEIWRLDCHVTPTFLKDIQQILSFFGSGCGSVGRVVISDTRGPQFESSHCKL